MKSKEENVPVAELGAHAESGPYKAHISFASHSVTVVLRESGAISGGRLFSAHSDRMGAMGDDKIKYRAWSDSERRLTR